MTNFPSSAKTWTALVDGLDQAKANDVNTIYDEVTAIETVLLVNLLRGGYANTETLSAAKTLTDNDKPLQFLDPGGAARDINLPAAGATNHLFVIVNTAATALSLTVKDAAASTIGTVAQGEAKLFVSNGSVWRQLTSGSSSSGGGSYAAILALGG